MLYVATVYFEPRDRSGNRLVNCLVKGAGAEEAAARCLAMLPMPNRILPCDGLLLVTSCVEVHAIPVQGLVTSAFNLSQPNIEDADQAGDGGVEVAGFNPKGCAIDRTPSLVVNRAS